MFTFLESTKIVLRAMGWSHDRNVDPTQWISFLQQAEYPVFELANTILRHLGGLDAQHISLNQPLSLSGSIPIVFFGNKHFNFLPQTAPDADCDSAPFWKQHPIIRAADVEICPIGSFDDYRTLFLTSDGKVYKGQFYNPTPLSDLHNRQASLTLVGSTIANAVDHLINNLIAYR